LLGVGGNRDDEKKCRCRKTAANSRRRHYDVLLRCGDPGGGSGDKSASINGRFHRSRDSTVASKLGCNRPDRVEPCRRYFTSGQPPSFIGRNT
jgi:hypothetical protein